MAITSRSGLSIQPIHNKAASFDKGAWGAVDVTLNLSNIAAKRRSVFSVATPPRIIALSTAANSVTVDNTAAPFVETDAVTYRFTGGQRNQAYQFQLLVTWADGEYESFDFEAHVDSTSVPVPSISITSPANGTTLDEGPLTVAVAVTSIVPADGTVVTVRNSATQASLGTGATTAGVATVTTSALTAGAVSITAEIPPVLGVPVVSPAIALTVVAESPSVTITSPTPAQQIQLGASVPIAATIAASAHGTLASEQYRLDGGSWTTLPHTTGTTYQTSVTAAGALGTHTVDVRATDAGGTVLMQTVTISYVEPVETWTGAYAFPVALGAQTSPSTGDLVLALDPTTATDGAMLDLTVPAGPTSFNWTLPGGWTAVADATVALDGVGLDGGVSWQPADAWHVYLQVDATNHVVRWTARRTPVALADALIWPMADTRAFRGGVAVPANNAIAVDAPDLVPDPGGDGGTVQRGGNGVYRLPAAATLDATVGWTVIHQLYVTTAPVGNPDISAWSDWRIGDGSVFDVVEFLGKAAAIDFYILSGNSNSGTDALGPYARIFGFWVTLAARVRQAVGGITVDIFIDGAYRYTITPNTTPATFLNNADGICAGGAANGVARMDNTNYSRRWLVANRPLPDAEIQAYPRNFT